MLVATPMFSSDYAVDRIVDRKDVGLNWRYIVRGSRYRIEEDTMKAAKDILKDFISQYHNLMNRKKANARTNTACKIIEPT